MGKFLLKTAFVSPFFTKFIPQFFADMNCSPTFALPL